MFCGHGLAGLHCSPTVLYIVFAFRELSCLQDGQHNSTPNFCPVKRYLLSPFIMLINKQFSAG